MNLRTIRATILAATTLTLSVCAGWSQTEEVITPEIIPGNGIISVVTPVVPRDVLNRKPEKIPVEKTLETSPKPEPVEIQGAVEKPEPEPEPEIGMSKEDMKLIAHMTMAEAEGESEKGQRLVIDTILNRVDSEKFPNTVYEVIYQPYQFSSIKDGRFARCHVMDDIYELVVEEVQDRTNSSVIFFRTGRYSDYGSPMFKEGAHYFSSY